MNEPCPVCGDLMDASRAAVSRADNKTRVCSTCGMAEAISAMFLMPDVFNPHVVPGVCPTCFTEIASGTGRCFCDVQ